MQAPQKTCCHAHCLAMIELSKQVTALTLQVQQLVQVHAMAQQVSLAPLSPDSQSASASPSPQ
jgi:hypothetical protein